MFILVILYFGHSFECLCEVTVLGQHINYCISHSINVRVCECAGMHLYSRNSIMCTISDVISLCKCERILFCLHILCRSLRYPIGFLSSSSTRTHTHLFFSILRRAQSNDTWDLFCIHNYSITCIKIPFTNYSDWFMQYVN